MRDITKPGAQLSVRPQLPPTPGQALRQYCLECLAAPSARQAYDCLCVWPPACALYPAHPFRGKAMPQQVAPNVTGAAAEFVAKDVARLEEIAARIPRRRASAKLIRQRCRDCYPEGGDCEVEKCLLYPWNPRGKGMRPKRVMSARKRAAILRNLMAAQNAVSLPKTPNQKASLTEVAPSATKGIAGHESGRSAQVSETVFVRGGQP